MSVSISCSCQGVTCDARVGWRDDRVIDIDVGFEVMGAYQMRLSISFGYVGWRSSEMQGFKVKKVQEAGEVRNGGVRNPAGGWRHADVRGCVRPSVPMAEAR